MKKIEIDALTDNLGKVISFVTEQLEAAQFPMKTIMQIELAVEEIFVNIAHYAYAPKTGKADISIEIVIDPTRAKITFADEGVPYDPLAKKDPDVTLSANERAIGGLGIFMVKKTMDKVFYEYKNGQNVLTLEKNL